MEILPFAKIGRPYQTPEMPSPGGFSWRKLGNIPPRSRYSSFIKKIGNLLIRWRYLIIGSFGLTFIRLQLIEHPVIHRIRDFFDSFEVNEFIIFLVALAILSLLLELLLRTIEADNRAGNVLALKQSLNLQLAPTSDWTDVVAVITTFVADITQEKGIIFVPYNQQTDSFAVDDLAGEFEDDFINRLRDSLDLCRDCTDLAPNQVHHLESSSERESSRTFGWDDLYCLPLAYDQELMGVFLFRLHFPRVLTREQIDILNNIGPGLAVNFKAVQQKSVLREIMLAKAVEEERLKFSRDLHDTLGQDLSFMRFKLDQLTQGDCLSTLDVLEPELVQLRFVAEEAYNLVRGTLTSLLETTNPVLSSLLDGQARLIAEHAHFEYKMIELGRPQILSPHVVQQIFFVHREALNNIAKYAAAHRVNTTLTWQENRLGIQIADNGKGFEPHAVDSKKHFGLEIMRKRIGTLRGSFNLQSTQGVGTEISIQIPIDKA